MFINNLSKRILKDRISREECKVVKEDGFACYFCGEKIEDFAYKTVIQDEIGDETYHIHTRC